MARHGGAEKTFKHYAGGDGLVQKAELQKLLADARIDFSPLPARMGASLVRDHFDANRDGNLSWAEFQAKLPR